MTTFQLCAILLLAFIFGMVFGISVGISVTESKAVKEEEMLDISCGLIPNEKCYILSESSLKKMEKDTKNDILNRLIFKLKSIDDCEYAMFSLGLIKEKAEELKKCNTN